MEKEECRINKIEATQSYNISNFIFSSNSKIRQKSVYFFGFINPREWFRGYVEKFCDVKMRKCGVFPEAYIKPSRTSMMELYCKNYYR